MALSGKVGASALGWKIKACTPSLNFETFLSICSAEKLTDTSHPVRSFSAPSLAPPAMKRRRARSGMVLTASRTKSCLSTPGIRSERSRPMMCPPPIFSAADDHGAEAFRHQHRQRDVHDQERDDRRHAEEMDVTGHFITAKQRRQPLQLHRFPNRKPRQHDQNADHDDAGIEKLLNVIVPGEVVMTELTGQRRLGVSNYAGRRNRQQLVAEPAGRKAERD